MRKVNLRMKEQLKYEIIKELVDHGGNNKVSRSLDVTIKSQNRLK